MELKKTIQNQILSNFHFFEVEEKSFLLMVDGSRIFEMDNQLKNKLKGFSSNGKINELMEFLQLIGFDLEPAIDDKPPEGLSIRSLSLAVAQKCNLGCVYCYAQGGEFGGKSKNMSWDIAKNSVDRLFENSQQNEKVHLAFLGGEPLLNRELIHQTVNYADQLSIQTGVGIGYSITTNGTLVSIEDGEFFEKHGFAVTVSLDGMESLHDRLRAFKSGGGSYRKIIQNIQPLLQMQRKMQISARVTVTPYNLNLPEILHEFISIGFHSIGFSPMLNSPTGDLEMDAPDIEVLLNQMIKCGREFEEKTIAGIRFPFSNMSSAMKEIHKGTHRPYPCGAGASYFGVSADGGLFACHRFVDDSKGRMGNVYDGLDRLNHDLWLKERHVHKQEPCNSCWAKYLCGGGCHHEVLYRGRPACDYIKGWLDYCLGAYIRLSEARPDYFGIYE